MSDKEWADRWNSALVAGMSLSATPGRWTAYQGIASEPRDLGPALGAITLGRDVLDAGHDGQKRLFIPGSAYIDLTVAHWLTDSRNDHKGWRWRRHECQTCHRRWTSYQTLERPTTTGCASTWNVER